MNIVYLKPVPKKSTLYSRCGYVKRRWGRICKCVTHSDVNKLICQWQPIEIDFPKQCRSAQINTRRVAAAHACVNKSKLVERMNIESEESFTPFVCSSILQAHTGFINSEPFTSESYERTYDL